MLSIRLMTPADIALGMRLKECAGWNQTEADWRRHLALEPAGCFVGCVGDQPAATLATTVFGGDTSGESHTPASAWIAMVLTDPDFRRRGLANALLTNGLGYAEARGAKNVWLDATEMGRPVYEKLGFTVTFGLTRWRGIARPAGAAVTVEREDVALRSMTAEDLAGGEVDDLDLAATGADRLRLLAALREETPVGALVAMRDPREVTALLGYALARRGSQATQVGPIIARTEPAGRSLLSAALTKFAGTEILVDIPDANRAASDVARAVGLAPERAFYRMVRKSTPGESAINVSPALWASAGPEFG